MDGRTMTDVQYQVPVVKCRYCQRDIAWVQTTNGKTMPIDPQPDERRGNVFCQYNAAGRLVGTVATRSEPRPPGVPFVPHFATCPHLNKERPQRQTLTGVVGPQAVQPDLFTQGE
jgi:hypothetical protein